MSPGARYGSGGVFRGLWGPFLGVGRVYGPKALQLRRRLAPRDPTNRQIGFRPSYRTHSRCQKTAESCGFAFSSTYSRGCPHRRVVETSDAKGRPNASYGLSSAVPSASTSPRLTRPTAIASSKNIPKEFPELDGGQCFPGASPVSWAPSDIATDTTKEGLVHAELHPASQAAVHHHQRRAYRRRPGRALRPTLAAGLRRGVHRRIDYRRAADPHPGGAGTARPGHVH